MNQEFIIIEKRKFDWLMKYCDMSLFEANEHYNRIDNVMPKINVGDKLYIFSSHDSDTEENEYYEVTVLKIVDYNEGKILVNGKGFFRIPSQNIEWEGSICNMYTKEEISENKYKII